MMDTAGAPWGLLMNAMHTMNIGEENGRNDCNSNYRQGVQQQFGTDTWRFMSKQEAGKGSARPEDVRALLGSRLQQNGQCNLAAEMSTKGGYAGHINSGSHHPASSPNAAWFSANGIDPNALLGLEAMMQHQSRLPPGGAVDEGRMRWINMIQAYGIPLPAEGRQNSQRGAGYHQPRSGSDSSSLSQHPGLTSTSMSTPDLQLKSSDSFSSSDLMSAYEDSLNGEKFGSLCSRKLKAPSAAHLLYMQQKAEGTKWVTVWKLPGWVDKAWVEEGFSRFGQVQKVMLLDGRFGLKLAHIQFPTNDCVSRVVEAELFVADNQLEVVPGKVQRARWLEGKAADRQHRR